MARRATWWWTARRAPSRAVPSWQEALRKRDPFAKNEVADESVKASNRLQLVDVQPCYLVGQGLSRPFARFNGSAALSCALSLIGDGRTEYELCLVMQIMEGVCGLVLRDGCGLCLEMTIFIIPSTFSCRAS